MNTELVLKAGPYAAMVVAALGFAARLIQVWVANGRGQSPNVHAGWRLLGKGRVARAACVALLLLLGAHLVALLAPAELRRALGTEAGLFLLEGIGFVLGLLLLLGALVGLARHLSSREGSWAGEIADSVLLSALLVTVLCGLWMAIRHRWASLWSLGTVMPYLRGVLRGAPEPALVTGTPFAAQLHVVASLAVLAALPHSRFGTLLARLTLWLMALVGAAVSAPIFWILRALRPQRVAAWLWPEEDLAHLAVRQQRRNEARRRLVARRARSGAVSASGSIANAVVAPVAKQESEERSLPVERGG